MAKIRMTYLNMHQSYGTKGIALEGNATFRMENSQHSTELKVALTEAQMQAVIEACAESIKEMAQKQAEAFHDEAKAISGQLLEHKE